MKGIAKLIFSVMSYMVGSFNDPRVSKNTFLESSYKAFIPAQDSEQDLLKSNLFPQGISIRNFTSLLSHFDLYIIQSL